MVRAMVEAPPVDDSVYAQLMAFAVALDCWQPAGTVNAPPLIEADVMNVPAVWLITLRMPRLPAVELTMIEGEQEF